MIHLLILLSLVQGPAPSPSPAIASGLHQAGVCERQGEKFVGRRPFRPGTFVKTPQLIRNVKPTWPQLPSGTVASGVWLGEGLIDAQGRVVRVWTLRQVRLKPPFPAFNEAPAKAFLQWEYKPALLDGVAVPSCVTIEMIVDVR